MRNLFVILILCFFTACFIDNTETFRVTDEPAEIITIGVVPEGFVYNSLLVQELKINDVISKASGKIISICAEHGASNLLVKHIIDQTRSVETVEIRISALDNCGPTS